MYLTTLPTECTPHTCRGRGVHITSNLSLVWEPTICFLRKKQTNVRLSNESNRCLSARLLQSPLVIREMRTARGSCLFSAAIIVERLHASAYGEEDFAHGQEEHHIHGRKRETVDVPDVHIMGHGH